MRRYDLCLVVTLAIFAASCGSGSHTQLQSLAVTPAQAAPVNQSTAQFKAIGTFTDGHTAEVAAAWTLLPFCPDHAPCALTLPQPGWLTLSNSGIAECTGTGPAWTIHATAPADINISLSQITVKTKLVTATAQVTCAPPAAS